jgi:hypothetical protein
LRGAPLERASAWLEEYRRFWERGFDRMDARLQTTRKGRKDD